MGKEETFFELYDLLEDRLNQRGHIQAKEAWDICKNYTKKSYNTFYVVFYIHHGDNDRTKESGDSNW